MTFQKCLVIEELFPSYVLNVQKDIFLIEIPQHQLHLETFFADCGVVLLSRPY
jgi:hypothetical protein